MTVGQLQGKSVGGGADWDTRDTTWTNGAAAPAPAPACPVCRPASGACKVGGTCDPAVGTCSAETDARDDGSCDDGSMDTVQDSCSAGVCAGVDICLGVVCYASSDCKVCRLNAVLYCLNAVLYCLYRFLSCFVLILMLKMVNLPGRWRLRWRSVP